MRAPAGLYFQVAAARDEGAQDGAALRFVAMGSRAPGLSPGPRVRAVARGLVDVAAALVSLGGPDAQGGNLSPTGTDRIRGLVGNIIDKVARSTVLQPVVARLKTYRRSRRPIDEAWRSSHDQEIREWEKRLRSMTPAMLGRCDPDLPLQPELAELIDMPEGATVRVLDCGAGALTFVGKKHPNYTIDLVAVDTLADGYDGALERTGVVPLVRGRGSGDRAVVRPVRRGIVQHRDRPKHTRPQLRPVRGVMEMLAS